ncbi:ferrochelatase [Asticcacaulis sp. AC460]|uniref:ferrochelatase n=1 Tax=Asticcacaulis sp. AC460 TaxID=1282360 RepID=UPI0003C40B25|nr:ferrochelatase [Asticcacaulis sp. AC460]ESQ90547.1 ferrochelatase [Asticcacaulis sp. AC460]
MTAKRVAVLVFNLGGPEKQADVQGFLYNLFADRRIIDLPWGIRQGLASVISSRRAPMAKKNYALMGGGSPILSETRDQAVALEKHLNKGAGIEAKVFIGMRYWHPFIENSVKEIEHWKPDEVVVLPLYPQFSSTTTLSGFEAFKKAWRGKAPVKYVCCYSDNDHFVEAHVLLIREWLKSKVGDTSNVRLLFSAHGLPEKIIKNGDPYQEQVESSVARIMAQLGDIDHVICYQSRVGPLKWIGPSTDDTIQAAGRDGKAVMLIPIAFVSEHIETLVELDIEYAELAEKAGVHVYRRVPALRTNKGLIQALGAEVMKALGAVGPVIGDHDCAKCHKFCPKKRAA